MRSRGEGKKELTRMGVFTGLSVEEEEEVAEGVEVFEVSLVVVVCTADLVWGVC